MIRSIRSWESYGSFLTASPQEVVGLAEAFARKGALCFGAFEGEAMTGLFVFSRFEENYLVTSRWLTRSEAAGREMLAYLHQQYPGYGVEFTFRPEDMLLKGLLLEAGATVFPEQRNMERRGCSASPADTSAIVLYSKAFEQPYLAMHRDSDPEGETYWTGEMVTANKVGFLVLLALADGVPVGYLDLGLGDEGNNVADLYVDPAHRRKAWGRKLLEKAVELTGDQPLTLQVDVENDPAIRLYESMGFRFKPESSWVDAIWQIDA